MTDMDTERHVTGNLNEKIYQKMGRYTVRRRHKKGWQRVVTAMAAIVVFCTTYALILPAITQERKPTCGMEEHEHEEACYREMEKILSCAVQVHIHGPECLDDQGLVICGNDQYLPGIAVCPYTCKEGNQKLWDVSCCREQGNPTAGFRFQRHIPDDGKLYDRRAQQSNRLAGKKQCRFGISVFHFCTPGFLHTARISI
jgi:hypothetical protein